MTQKCLTNNDEQQARQALREWYQSGLGQSVLTQIQTHINEVVHKIYGYQGLQIGQISPQVDLLENSGLLRKQCIDFDHTQQGIERLFEHTRHPRQVLDGELEQHQVHGLLAHVVVLDEVAVDDAA